MRDIATTVLELSGLVLIAYGISRWSIPAMLVFLGFLSMVLGFVIAKPTARNESP